MKRLCYINLEGEISVFANLGMNHERTEAMRYRAFEIQIPTHCQLDSTGAPLAISGAAILDGDETYIKLYINSYLNYT